MPEQTSHWLHRAGEGQPGQHALGNKAEGSMLKYRTGS